MLKTDKNPHFCPSNVEQIKYYLTNEIHELIDNIHQHFTELQYDKNNVDAIMKDVYTDIHEAIREENNFYATFK